MKLHTNHNGLQQASLFLFHQEDYIRQLLGDQLS